MAWRVLLAVLVVPLTGCELRSDVIEPSLRQKLTDPVHLATLCKVAPADLGSPSAESLTITELHNHRGFFSSEGKGSAEISYTPMAKGWSSGPCKGSVHFDFHDGRGTKVTAATIQVTEVAVQPR